MGEADDKMLKAIKHYQESLERHTKTGKSEKLLHAIGKLSLLPIRVWHLEETGVGRTVNGLKKFEGTVGEQARNLVDKWKFMVKGEEEKEQNEHTLIKVEKDAAPVQESPQTATRETKCDDDKRSYHSSNHNKSRSLHNSSQSSRHCDESKANNSEDKNHKRHNYKSSPSDSEIASKRHKVIKTEIKQKHSKYSDRSSESESDESDSSNHSTSKRTHCQSSPARSTSGSSDNSSSDSSESSSSDEDDSDKNHNRKSHSSNDSDSESYSHKESPDARSDKKSKNNGVNSQYSKIDDSKKKSKDSHSDARDLKYKEKLVTDSKQSSSKTDERNSRHHNSKSESSKSKHTPENSREPEPKSSSSTSKKSEPRESEKSKDRSSHRSSTKSGKSEENKKDDANKEKSHKEKKDDNSETNRKRSREESTSRESKKCKTSFDTKDSRRPHGQPSSSKKDRDKHSAKEEKQKETFKQAKEKKSVSETSKDKSSTNKIPKKLLDGIDSGSGTSFADVLGMLEAPVYSKSKKKSSASEETIPSPSSKKTSSVPREDKTARTSSKPIEGASFKTNGEQIPNLLKDPAGLDPLDINMSSLLPSITPNYRPLGVTLESSKPMYMDDEAFSRVITAKHQRTKVYSGNKAGFTKVPTLFDLCSRILQDNLDALEYTGGVPYSILKPILEKANPNQLYMLEFHNPYLIEDTDELWQLHCQKEFRNKKREELESWREMYLRCLDEREAKLKALTANIKQSQDKSIPVRQTKLAYVDSVVKPPRNIARKQVKNGLAIEIKKPSQTPTERLNQLARSGEASKIAVPNPSRSAVVERSSSSSSHIKPKKAPLMAKTLSLLKNRFGRR